MRRVRAEARDDELRKVREVMQADQQLAEAPAVIPEPVAQRMGKRMLPFVGIPLFGGMGVFVACWYFAVYKNIEFEPALVAGSTIGILVFSLLVCFGHDVQFALNARMRLVSNLFRCRVLLL
jgi:hypothetical protein